MRCSTMIFINHFLRMLHADSYCKCFWLHRYFVLVQHGKCITGTMTDCKNSKLCIENIFFLLFEIVYF